MKYTGIFFISVFLNYTCITIKSLAVNIFCHIKIDFKIRPKTNITKIKFLIFLLGKINLGIFLNKNERSRMLIHERSRMITNDCE